MLSYSQLFCHKHTLSSQSQLARYISKIVRTAILGDLLTDESDIAIELMQKNLYCYDNVDQTQALVRQRFGGSSPRVLDFFGGDGSISLEVLRLGAQAYAVEYNPIAYLILKAAVEFPQRYGQADDDHKSSLADAVRFWAHWVFEQARKELQAFYLSDTLHSSVETPIAYIWSYTVRCPNPNCGSEIPLFRQFWLARKGTRREIALAPIVDKAQKHINFVIVQRQGNSWQVIDNSISLASHPLSLVPFDPSKGTVRRSNAICLICNTGISDKLVKAEAQAGRMGHRLVAVVTRINDNKGGYNYRLPTEKDIEAFYKAEMALQNLLQTPSPWAFGLSWIPKEPIDQHNLNIVSGHGYNFREWGQLFNSRQLLALCTFGKWVREAYRQILQETNDPEFAKAVVTYLALAVDRFADYNASLCLWHVTKETITPVSTHDLKMAWDYAEINPFSSVTSDWKEAVEWIYRYLTRESCILQAGCAYLASAASLPFPDKHFDAVIIDPPYTDNVSYADFSDFFYVWLRRTVGDLYPEAFQWALVPKDEEAVVNPARFGSGKKGKQIAQAHYQIFMQKSFEEIYRVLKPEGMAIVMCTYRSLEAWERLMLSLLKTGLYPIAFWPVHTEIEASTHQCRKGAIQNMIMMACRRRPENAGVGWYVQIRADLERVIRERLDAYWKVTDVMGMDICIAVYTYAIGVIGQYQHIKNINGQEIALNILCDEIIAMIIRYVLEKLGVTTLDVAMRFYILYRWLCGGDKLSNNDADRFARSVGATLYSLASENHLIEQRRKYISLLTFSDRMQNAAFRIRVRQVLKNGYVSQLSEIDQIQLLLWLWHSRQIERVPLMFKHYGINNDNHRLIHIMHILADVENDKVNTREVNTRDIKEEASVLRQLLANTHRLIRQADIIPDSDIHISLCDMVNDILQEQESE